MEVILKEPEKGAEDRVTVEVKKITPKILKAIAIMRQPDDLTLYQDSKVFKVATSDVYYIESVDLKTYIYTSDEVYLSKLTLSGIEKLLEEGDFIRVSKQQLVNLQMIENISPAGAGRFQALLSNKEVVIISRQFVPKLKEVYGI